MTLEEMRARLESLRTAIVGVADATPEQWAALESDEVRSGIRAHGDYALAEYEALKPEYDAGVARARQIETVRNTVTDEIPGADSPQHLRHVDTSNLDASRLRGTELRDAALAVLEREGKAQGTDAAAMAKVEKLLRTRNDDVDGRQIARRLIITESDAYRSAFQKGVVGITNFSAEESRALDEFRAANEGTGSAGGFGIPVLIDPTIILTSGAVDAPIMQIARMVTVTTDAWKGVSSAGVSWSYDAEAAAVSDDTPTLAQPNIPVYAARGFIPYSIEVGQDYPGFAEEMSMLLSQGYVDLVAKQTMTGSGSSQPTGIFTSMANVTTNPAHVTVQTLGSVAASDFRAAWAALPERFRGKATWVYSPTVQEKVSAFGNNLALSDFTENLSVDTLKSDGTFSLLGRPVIVGDYAPAFSGTTGATNYAVVGDFSNFVIVSRAGMTVEPVQHLFDTSTGRPTGQRGWFAWARHGFDQVAPNAFRLLSNT